MIAEVSDNGYVIGGVEKVSSSVSTFYQMTLNRNSQQTKVEWKSIEAYKSPPEMIAKTALPWIGESDQGFVLFGDIDYFYILSPSSKVILTNFDIFTEWLILYLFDLIDRLIWFEITGECQSSKKEYNCWILTDWTK